MLRIASVGATAAARTDVASAADDPSHDDSDKNAGGLHRAELRSGYEAALRSQLAGEHASAAAQFASVLESLPAAAATRSDEAWLQRLRRLCLRCQAASRRALGQTPLALQCLRGALCLCGDDDEAAADWRAAADCAVEAEDWPAARLCFEQCLRRWPREPAALRGLAAALLRVGDEGACAVALEELETACSRLGEKEAWLLKRLRGEHPELPRVGGGELEALAGRSGSRKRVLERTFDEEAAERGLAEVREARAKRLRAAVAAEPQRPPTEEVFLEGERPSLGLLLLAAHGVAIRGTSQWQPVSFTLGRRASAVPPEAGPMVAPGAIASSVGAPPPELAPPDSAPAVSTSSSAGSAASQALESLWNSLRPLVARPWPPEELPLKWAIAALRSNRPRGGNDETTEVARFLGLDATGMEPRRSPTYPWRKWLRCVVEFALRRRDLLQDSQQQLELTVELAVSFLLISCPGQHCFSVKGPALRKSWASDKFLIWVEPPPTYDEADDSPLLASRQLLSQHGLAFAEVCAVLRFKAPALADVGGDFLHAWLRVGPASGSDGSLPASARTWLRVLGSPASETPAEVAATLANDAAAAALTARYFWAAATLWRNAAAAALNTEDALRLCSWATGLHETAAINTSFGEAVTSARCTARLSGYSCLQGTSVARQEVPQPTDEPQDLADLLQQVTVAQMPAACTSAPSETPDVKVIWRFIQRLQATAAGNGAACAADEAVGAPALLVALARLLGQFAVGVGCGEAGPQFEHAELLAAVIRCTAARLAGMARGVMHCAAEPCTRVPDAWQPLLPRFHPSAARLAQPPTDGLRSSSSSAVAFLATELGAVCLSPACEQVLVACLALLEGLVRRGLRELLPLAHAALTLATNVLGLLPLGACAGPNMRGGLLLARVGRCEQEVEQAWLWVRLCEFLGAAHDLGLLLAELSVQAQQRDTTTEGKNTNLLATKCVKLLFGKQCNTDELEFDAHLCPTPENPLSLPRALLACALRLGGTTVAHWHRAVTQWLEQVVAGRAHWAWEGCTADCQQLEARDVPRKHFPLLWRYSIQALQAADGEAASCSPASLGDKLGDRGSHQMADDGAELEVAVCRVLARGLACLMLVPHIDPHAPAAISGRQAGVRVFLSDARVCFSVPSAAADQTADQAPPPSLENIAFQHRGERPLHTPHGLALALATCHTLAQQGRPPEVATSGRRFGELCADVATHLDAQLFPLGEGVAEAPQRLPQVMFHPCLVPRWVLEYMQDSIGKFMQGACPVHFKMTQLLRDLPIQAKDTKAGKSNASYPPELWSPRIHSFVTAIEATERAQAALHRTEDAKSATPSVALAMSREFQLGLELRDCVAATPGLHTPMDIGEAYSYALELALKNLKWPTVPELLRLVVQATKALAVKPDQWLIWAAAASLFKHLYFAQDDKTAGEENWHERLVAWERRGAPTIVWGARLRVLWGHTRALAIMLGAHFAQRIEQNVAEFAAANPQGSGLTAASLGLAARCRADARGWLSANLDLLLMLRCRRQALAQTGYPTDEHHVKERAWLLRRCDFVARQLLWLLANCSDMAPEFAQTTEVMRRLGNSWPRPTFADVWLGLGDDGPPLLTYKAAGDRQPPPYLWYLPYLVARCQWKLALADGADLDMRHVLVLAKDAASVENWLRTSARTPESQTELVSPASGGQLVIEPLWRLNLLRLRIVQRFPNLWQVAADFPWQLRAQSADGVLEDGMVGLASFAGMDTRYQAKLFYERSRFEESSGRFAEAVQEIEKVFTIPKDFPAGTVKVGFRVQRVERKDWQGRGESTDLWQQHGQLERTWNMARNKVLLHCLHLHRRCISEVLGGGATLADSDGLPEEFRTDALSPKTAVPAAKVLNLLPRGRARPRAWEALHLATGLLLIVLRGFRADSGHRFWVAFRAACARALRRGYRALLRAGKRSEKGTSRPKPCLDWPLLCMLRAALLSLEAAGGEPAEEVEALRLCYAGATAQMQTYAAGPAGRRPTGRPKPQEAAELAERFFQSLVPYMPMAEGRWGNSAELRASPPAAAASPRPRAAPQAPVAAVPAAGAPQQLPPRPGVKPTVGDDDVVLLDSDGDNLA